jgi:hypothetical protein
MPAIRRERRTYSDDTLKSIRDFVAMRTITLKENGLRIDWKNLDDAETRELVELTQEAERGEGGFRLDRLSKRRARRWEALAARGSGEPESFFEDARQMAEIRALATEANRVAVRRPITRREEGGLFDEFVSQFSAEPPFLFADHLALGIVIFACLHSGKAIGPRSRIEQIDGESALIVDSTFGVVGSQRDPYSMFARWRQGLQHLERNAWVQVMRNGNEWTIRPGPRALRAMGRTTMKKKLSA